MKNINILLLIPLLALIMACAPEVEDNKIVEVNIPLEKAEPVEVQTKKPALPQDEDLPVTEQLKYIFDTDHEDRIDGTFIKEKDRDSLRLQHVQELYKNNKILTLEEKYYAAFIFTHAGGPFIKSDPNNFLIAHQLFQQVSQNSCNYTVAQEASVYAKTAFAKFISASLEKEEIATVEKEEVKPATNKDKPKPDSNT